MKILNFFLILLSMSSGQQCSASMKLPLDTIETLETKERGLRPMIVGGQVAPHIYPYMASLQAKSGKTWSHYCGASLISPNWLLTAGHCVKYITNPGTNYRAILGRYDLRKSVRSETIRYFSKIVIHPNYIGTSNDIALIKIAPITTIPVINMTNTLYPAGTMMRVIGWGSTKEGTGVQSNVLMQVDVPIVSNTICKKSYAFITDQDVCAGYQQGGKDSCQGDSGGPLFYNKSGIIEQVGIVFYGTGCARPNYYGVYTSVKYYANWIRSVITTSMVQDQS